jgi:hypothetical protein
MNIHLTTVCLYRSILTFGGFILLIAALLKSGNDLVVKATVIVDGAVLEP